MLCLISMKKVCQTLLMRVNELSNDASKRPRNESKSWLRFDDVANCRDVESFNVFVEQFLSERGLAGENRKRLYWALFYAWKSKICSDR